MSEDPTPRLLPEVVHPPTPGAGGPRSLELAVSGETEPLVLAHGNLFCVTNRRGDIAPACARDLGLFHEDTRHLSYLELFIAGGPPVVLSADTAGPALAQIDLTLSDTQFGGFLHDPQNFLHIRRKQLLDDELVEQIVLTNHLRRPIDLWLELRMAADFADIFEVRGARRNRRGAPKAPQYAGDNLLFAYQGLDGQLYRTSVRVTPEPTRMGPTGPFWDLHLSPGEATVVEVVVASSRVPAHPSPPLIVPAERAPAFDTRARRLDERHHHFVRSATRITSNNVLLNQLLRHALEDIDSLRLSVGGQGMLAAGIPWFAAPFGRDSLLTALELLSVAPELARDTLIGLATYQGTRDDPWREEEPGKIMHELRRGEMSRTGEVPHSPYYGTIDATPLWLMLLGETWHWLGDLALVESVWPAAEAALAWIERRLDVDKGLLCYHRTHDRGLENQGWKDSRDGVSFPDGEVAQAPIALIEVQGYVVGALNAMATLCRVRGDEPRAAALTERATRLRARIQEAFWVPEAHYYALALDGQGRQVRTITSNPGHLLFAGAVEQVYAERVVETLLSDGMYSGYGARTLARGQAVYNPLSYHNGSVWPHDNAVCALGAARYGRTDAAELLFQGLYEAALRFRRYRLPELFCGLGRGEGDFLVHYPVSCSPQAWASGAVFLLLQAVLGLSADAPRRRLTIALPRLPQFLDRLEIENLRVGQTHVTLLFQRHDTHTHASVLGVQGDPLAIRIEL